MLKLLREMIQSIIELTREIHEKREREIYEYQRELLESIKRD